METGFLHLRARSYDPDSGRFLQRDPVAGRGAVPGTLNRYAYMLNNPVNFVDPSGTVAGGVCGSASGGVPGLYGSASVCGVATSSGEVGVQISLGYGGTTGFTGGFGVGGELSTADTLDDLEQRAVFVGGSARLGRGVSGDIAVAGSTEDPVVTGSVSGGVGGSFTPPYAPGGELHGGASYTETIVEGELPDTTLIGLGIP